MYRFSQMHFRNKKKKQKHARPGQFKCISIMRTFQRLPCMRCEEWTHLEDFFFIFHFWFQQKLIYISVPIHVINSKKKKKNDHPTAVDILNVLTIHPPASIVHTVWCSTKCTFIIVFSLLAVVALTTVWFPQRLKRIFVANFWLNFFVCSILDICAMEKVKKEGLMQ